MYETYAPVQGAVAFSQAAYYIAVDYYVEAVFIVHCIVCRFVDMNLDLRTVKYLILEGWGRHETLLQREEGGGEGGGGGGQRRERRRRRRRRKGNEGSKKEKRRLGRTGRRRRRRKRRRKVKIKKQLKAIILS